MTEKICPGGSTPDPNIIWCDDFEDGDWTDTWDVNNYQPQNGVECGNRGYKDNCCLCSGLFGGPDANGGYSARTGSYWFWGNHSEIYFRWYTRVSDPFIWGNDESNMTFHDGPSGMVNLNKWGTLKPMIQVAANDTAYGHSGANLYQNQGNDITLIAGHWYLFEWHMKINTVGVEDGIEELWVDDVTLNPSITKATQTLRVRYTNVNLLYPGRETERINDIWVTAYHSQNNPGNNIVYWDNIVVSKSRIGPTNQSSCPPVTASFNLQVI